MLVETARANPALLFSSNDSPLSITRQRLEEASVAYQKGDYDKAKRLAVSAYLDGFELVENSLDARDKALRQSIESGLLNLRQELSDKQNVEQVKQSLAVVMTQLEEAEELLTGSSMSDATLFSASFIILLREGLEALLVVLALFTVLLRSNKKEAIKYVHFGWGAALVSGILTWIVAQYLVTISGASREIMEGVAAMLAAVVLFYVGFWMHSKTQADHWQEYIQQNIAKSLNAGTLWGISGLAFIAVYREVFETVLFYQSLLTQTAPTQQFALVGGFVFAVFVLMLITWLMIKYSVKLPISRFFSTTTYLLLALSFVLAGKAISALQEAAVIGISPFPISFQIEWLGINPTWQGVATQFLILLLSSLLIGKQWFKLKFGHMQSIKSNS
jgi:high-affinity iron transporter